MRKISRYLGIVGLIFLLLGALGYAIAPIFLGFYVIPWVLASVALGIYLAFNYHRVHEFLTSRSARYGAGSAVSILLVLGIVIMVAAFTARHNTRYDLTGDRRHSLAPQTLKVLGSLRQEVKVTGFFPGEGSLLTPQRELLDRYSQVTPFFKYELIDPDRHPLQTQEMGVTRYGTVVVGSGPAREKIDRLNEETLTNVILRVTRTDKKTIYFLTGHGEKDIEDQEKNGYSQVRDKLIDQNYEVRNLVLMQKDQVPADAAVVVVAGPTTDLLANETAALERYLLQGGKVMFLLDPRTVPGLADFLTRFNVLVGQDVVIDQESRAYGFGYSAPLIQTYTQHPIIENFSAFSIFPLARSVSLTRELKKEVQTLPLAMTGVHAWAETDLDLLTEKGTAQFDAGRDSKGEISVAVVGTLLPADGPEEENPAPGPNVAARKEKQGKFVVFGDSDFAANTYLNVVGNSDLFFSSLSWLAEESDLVAVRPKEGTTRPLFLTAIQGRLVFWIPVAVMPLLVFSIGMWVFLARRRNQ